MYFERDKLNPSDIGQAALQGNQLMITKCLQAAKDCQIDCAHVLYDDLVTKPMDTVRQVYAQFNWEFTPTYESNLTSYLSDNNKKRTALRKANNTKNNEQSLHNHSLEQFGLEMSDIDTDVYNEYIAKFDLKSLKF